MTKSLLQEIDEFLASDGVQLTATGLGLAVLNDGKFVSELRAGRRVWPDTETKVRHFIRNYQPADKRGAAA